MNKYLLLSICYAFISPITQAQLIIGDLQIETTNKNNQIKITNISSKPIDKIIIGGKIANENIRVLKPNKSIFFTIPYISKEEQAKKEKENKALSNLLGIPPDEL